MIKSVKFLSQGQAENITPAPNIAIISIMSPNSPPARLDEGSFHSIRREWFYDIDRYIYLRDYSSGRINVQHPITEDQAKNIISYIESLKDDTKELELIVHCEMGVSRSAAIAKFVQDYYNVPIATDFILFNDDDDYFRYHNRKVFFTLRKSHEELKQYEKVFAGKQ